MSRLFTPWRRTSTAFVVERATESTGEVRAHRIESLTRVSADDEPPHWVLVAEPGGADATFHLHEEDVVALEKALGRTRDALVAHAFESSAPTAADAIAAILIDTRAPTLEAFVPALVAALEESVQREPEGATPLCRFLFEAPWGAPGVWWLAQSLVARDLHGPVWNASAKEVFYSLFQNSPTELRFSAAPTTGGFEGVSFRVRQNAGEYIERVEVTLDGFGGARVMLGDQWVALLLSMSPSRRIQQALDQLDRGDVYGAASAFGELASIPRVDPIVHLHRDRANAKWRLSQEAFAAFERQSSTLTDRPRLLVLLRCAADLLADKKRDEALYLLQRATELFPKHIEGWYALSLLCVREGQANPAIGAGQRALRIEPGHARVHYTLACAYTLRAGEDDPECAAESLARALALDPALASSIAQDPDFAALTTDARFAALRR